MNNYKFYLFLQYDYMDFYKNRYVFTNNLIKNNVIGLKHVNCLVSHMCLMLCSTGAMRGIKVFSIHF